MEKINTDFVSDEEGAAELGPDYDPPCSQLTYEADIRYAKEQILKRRKKKSIQGNIIKASNSNINRSCIFLFKSLQEQNHVFKICFITLRGYLATRKLLVSWAPTWFLNRWTQTTKKTGVCAPK